MKTYLICFVILTLSYNNVIAQCASNAGLDDTTCGQTYILQGNISQIGSTALWTSDFSGTLFSDSTQPITSVFIPTYSGGSFTVNFILTETNTSIPCTSSDTVAITFVQQPNANAGTDISLCQLFTNLAAIPSVGTGTWTATSGPGILTFTNLNSATPSVFTTLQGIYNLTWTENNGNGCVSSDSMILTLTMMPVANAGFDDAICQLNYLFAAVPSIGTGTWSQLSGPGFPTFSNLNSPTSVITVTNYGNYSFIWTENNGNGCIDKDSVTITFNTVPIPDAGLDFSVCGKFAHICADTTVSGGFWSCPLGGIAYYSAPIDSATAPSYQDSACAWIRYGSENDTVIMYWREFNGVCLGVDSVNVFFSNCSLAGIDDHSCGQTYTFNPFPHFTSGSTFHWTCLTSSVIFSNDTLLNTEVIIPNYSPSSINYIFVLTEINELNSYSNSDTVIISFFSGCNEITGTVYYDINNNGIMDSSEVGVANKFVKINNDFVLTDSNGFYHYIALAGNYNISIANMSLYLSINPISHNASFLSSGMADSLNDFAIIIKSDTNLIITGNISTARPGFQCNHYFFISNDRINPITSSVKIILDSRVQYLNNANLNPSIVNGNVLEWLNLPISSNGFINLVISTNIPSSIAIGTTLIDSAIVLPITGDAEPLNNIFIATRNVSGSYDPNEKSVQPEEGITTTQLSNGSWLNYTICFQNTGNDTAFTVILKDTLSSLLDISTLQTTGFSHPYTVQIIDDRVILWSFTNILLPDSSINEQESKGFVSYRIKPLSTLSVGNQINNTAYIYFDYNLPIVTNTTFTNILNSDIIRDLTYNNNNVQVMPNPFTENCKIVYSISQFSNVTLEIYDIIGNKIAILCNETQQIGTYVKSINSFILNSNQIYLVRLVVNKKQFLTKILKL